MRDLRNEKFEKMRKEAEDKQLSKIRNHPHVPDDFDWRTYVFLNPDLTSKKVDTEFLAIRHWIKMGRKNGLNYKVEDVTEEEINVYLPEMLKPLEESCQPETAKKRRAIYTCISGNYDSIKEIEGYDEDWEYICFTDSSRIGHTEHWEIREIPKVLDRLDPTRKARALKVLPHVFLPEFEETLWIDGTIEVLKSPSAFISRHTEPDDVFAISTHPDRTCIYEERDACIKFGKDDNKVLNKQAQIYEREGYPKNWGMVQSGIIYRKNTPEVANFCNLWWEQILKLSKRDQMSFNYVLWKNPIPVRTMKPSILCSEYFWLWTHKEREGKRAKIRKDYDKLQNFINGQPV